ncbi:MAG: hypothetical protein AB1896_14165 [Thermodesulfobacteriota bacterium]
MSRRKSLLAVLVLLAVMAAASAAPAQGPSRLSLRISRVTFSPGEPVLLNLFLDVFDESGRSLPELSDRSLFLIEDGAPYAGPLEVQPYAATDRPLAYAVLIDNREDLAASLTMVQNGAAGFIDRMGFRYQGTVISYADSPRVMAGPTAQAAQLEAAVRLLDPVPGHPRLSDALVLGVRTVKAAETRPVREGGLGRRVLLLFTEGLDQGSMFSWTAVAAGVLESEAALFVLGYGRPDTETMSGLAALAEQTGGAFFFAYRPEDLGLLSEIAAERVRSQYVLTFPPQVVALDGRVHHLEVRLGIKGDVSQAGVEFKAPLIRTPRARLEPAAVAGVVILVLAGVWLAVRLRRGRRPVGNPG